jgi:hypothetical protein
LKTDAKRRAAIALTTLVKALSPADEVTANADAALFPGAVPESAERVTASVDVDLSVPRLHSTGLYAPPGEVITVTLKGDDEDDGLSVRIGSQADRIWTNANDDMWKRWPNLILERRLVAGENTVASPHGGLIYIDVPASKAAVTVTLTVQGAVRSPRFILGTTTAQQWQTVETKYAAPWAELISDNFIVTVAAQGLAGVADPTAGVDWWRRAVASHTELSQRPAFLYPERYVNDAQVSLGYLHSGYPTTGTIAAPLVMFDPGCLSQGSCEWGNLHELGHNRQQSAWTFDGTVEVTVNLFTLYTGTALTGIPSWNFPWLESHKQQARDYLKQPAFAVWKASPGVALTMYAQIVREFGWQPYKDVFKEYAQLPAASLPQTDDDKRDQWMIRMAKRLNVNLGPFFDMWAVPVSAAAKAQIANLPPWTPLSI